MRLCKQYTIAYRDIVNDIAAGSTKSGAEMLAARAGISKKEAYKRLVKEGK